MYAGIFTGSYNSMVFGRGVLRAANWLIGFLLLVVLGALWWFFARPLPQVSGTLRAPIVHEVEIVRDKLGVPHIRAASFEDALFAQGYVTASERLWQMDVLRRLAAGDLAEVIGPAALSRDESMRKLRMRRIAEAAAVAVSPELGKGLGEYVRGVNYFIDTHRGRLPFEFAVLGYNPRPWSAVDSILVGLFEYQNLTTSWPDHIQRKELAEGGNAEKVAFLFPARAGNEVQPGSNAWAVSGAHTASGHPMLANDMHLEFSMPGIWFMTALEIPGWKVSGVTIPGLPGIVVGHNTRIAWGVTNLHFNVQDLYIEKIDEQTGQYEFRGRTEQAIAETELIPVKGRKPVQIRQWITRHGPVFLDDHGEHIALKWTAEVAGFDYPFLDIDRARNWQEFNTAVARLPGPGQNFVYADVDGNIGYHGSGKLPIRHGFTGDVPLDGASGKNEWDGFIPYAELPSAWNPTSGIIVTANQNPFPVSYPYTVSGAFASPYRSNQIRSMLRAKEKLTPSDFIAVQKDVYSGFEDDLAKAIVRAWDAHQNGNEDLRTPVSLLRSFNGQLDKDSAAALIVVLSDRYLRSAMAESASKGKGATYSYQMSYAAASRLLRERPPGWFANYDLTLLQALRDAVREAQRKQGRNVDRWKYGSYLRVEVTHPIGHQLPLLSGWFDVGSVTMSGGSTTVKQTTRTLFPSERFVAVPGDWDRSLLNVPIGESGHMLSKHYKDEWDAYYNGRSYPMPFEHVEAESTMRLAPQ